MMAVCDGLEKEFVRVEAGICILVNAVHSVNVAVGCRAEYRLCGAKSRA
jgi:hypothetical protein